MIYFIILFLLFFLAFFFDFLEIKKSRSPMYTFCLLIFIALSGLRYKVGGDSYSYKYGFDNEVTTLSNINSFFLDNKWEPLFKLLMSLSKTIYDDFFVFQILHALIINILFFKFFRKYTKNIFTSLFIYAFFTYLYLNTEILRESLAIAIFTLMYPYYENKRWKPYYLLAFLAIGFHYSALILLIFPLFRNLKLNQKSILLLILVFIGIGVLNTLLPINQLLFLLGNSVADRYDQYSNIKMNLNGMIYTSFFFVWCPLIAIRLRKNATSPYIHDFENMKFIYLFLAIIFVAVSGFGRFLNYLIPFMIVFYADCIMLILKHKRLKQYALFLLPVFLIIPLHYRYTYYTTSTAIYYPNTNNFSRYYPYSNVIEQKEYPFREIIYLEGLSDSYYNSLNRQ